MKIAMFVVACFATLVTACSFHTTGADEYGSGRRNLSGTDLPAPAASASGAVSAPSSPSTTPTFTVQTTTVVDDAGAPSADPDAAPAQDAAVVDADAAAATDASTVDAAAPVDAGQTVDAAAPVQDAATPTTADAGTADATTDAALPPLQSLDGSAYCPGADTIAPPSCTRYLGLNPPPSFGYASVIEVTVPSHVRVENGYTSGYLAQAAWELRAECPNGPQISGCKVGSGVVELDAAPGMIMLVSAGGAGSFSISVTPL